MFEAQYYWNMPNAKCFSLDNTKSKNTRWQPKVIANTSDALRAASEAETSAKDSAKDLVENNSVKDSENGPVKDSGNVPGVDFASGPAMG